MIVRFNEEELRVVLTPSSNKEFRLAVNQIYLVTAEEWKKLKADTEILYSSEQVNKIVGLQVSNIPAILEAEILIENQLTGEEMPKSLTLKIHY